MKVCKISDLEENKPTSVEIEDEAVVLIRQGETVYALKDECTHEEFPLSAGWVQGTHIHCALHGAKFNIEDGATGGLPAYEDVETFDVEIVDDWVEVNVDA